MFLIRCGVSWRSHYEMAKAKEEQKDVRIWNYILTAFEFDEKKSCHRGLKDGSFVRIFRGTDN
jgi:hypothetical protein